MTRRKKALVALAGVVLSASGVLLAVGFESFVVPTGSMWPTLRGRHHEVRCVGCAYPFDVARPGNPRCPVCGARSELGESDPELPGERLIANKLVYRFGAPGRWDAALLAWPKDTTKTFVKRVVGLGGETIDVNGRGDVRVRAGDAMAVARKPRDLQESLWHPVHDAAFANKVWRPDQTSRWVIEEELAILSFREQESPDTFVEWRGQATDRSSYDDQGGEHAVGDVRIRATVTAENARVIRIATVENGRVLVAEIPVGGTGNAATLAAITSGATSVEVARATVKPISPGQPTELSLAFADEWVTLTVRGEVVLEWHDPAPFATTTSSTVRLGASGNAKFARIKIDRDVFYSAMEPVTVPAGECFTLGDNVPNSQDSRTWGTVPYGNLIGRVCWVLPTGR